MQSLGGDYDIVISEFESYYERDTQNKISYNHAYAAGRVHHERLSHSKP